ncbi:MAG: hypothetical protein EOP85_10365 [Verrucomicrobiaceae bacterium]|nr:MAG: hypothetical protein EOP85_10365 [Verrucomicrobiaceae bacterium]
MDPPPAKAHGSDPPALARKEKEVTERTESILETLSRLPSSTATAEKLLVGDRKEQRQKRRSGSVSDRPLSPVIHVRRYQKPSWLTSHGVNRKRKMIEAKGLPNMTNWRFITLTVDRTKFPDPLQAYLHGADRLRRFMEAGRKLKLWKSDTKWAWKFEFQGDGFPHWHFFIGSRFKYTRKQLEQVKEIWGMGRTEVQRIEDSKFGYGFKYAFKPVSMESEEWEADEFERLAPDWFLDYVGKKEVRVDVRDDSGEVVDTYHAEKSVTFRRVRFWQTSKGFYTGRRQEVRPAKPQKTWGVPVTVRHALDNESRTVQVIARRGSGQYESSLCVTLTQPLEKFWALVGFDTMNAGAVGLGVYSFVIPTHRLLTDKKTSWQLQPILRKNRLNLRQAERLRNNRESLQTC